MKTTTYTAVITASLLLALTGCTTGTGDDPDATGEASDAAPFVACLTAAGVDAKVGDEGTALVRLPGSSMDDDGVISQSSGSGSGEEPLLIVGDADGSTWVAAETSAYFADDPDTQDAYAECESEFPDFTQPDVAAQNDAGRQEDLAQQREDALEFARCGREAGFAWVADPEGGMDESPAIALPADLSADEFRSLLDACYSPEQTIVWSVPEDLGFDFQAVLDEFADGTIGESSSTAGDGA